MRVPCPMCKRLGRVPKAYPDGTVMAYCGPNGESWPHETCQTCMGSGWVNDQQPMKTDTQIQIETIIGPTANG